jgi:DDE superfamily endonuclease
LAFLKKAVKPHAGRDIHVVLDNLSTHTTPDVCAWLEKNPHVHFHFTPVGSSWLNQIETWFGIITRQSICRGTFSSVKVLINQIRDYIMHGNTSAKHLVAVGMCCGQVVATVGTPTGAGPNQPPRRRGIPRPMQETYGDRSRRPQVSRREPVARPLVRMSDQRTRLPQPGPGSCCLCRNSRDFAIR